MFYKTWVFTGLLLLLFSFLGDAESFDDLVIELIEEHGYLGERHQVITEDGYKLMLHRIRKHNQTSNVLREPILMVHGIMLTSGDWILLGPDKALSYLLIDNGYDVWLGNSRGNTYSMDHNTLDPLKREFWNFSFHEMGYYDLPAMIDYILNVTNHTKLFYVGHSQGTTQLLVLLSTRPEYNEKILEAHLLCPVSFCKHVPHPLATIFADNFDGIVAATGAFNFGTVPKIMKFLIQICANPVTIVFCYPWLNSIVGFNKNFENYIEPEVMSITLKYLTKVTGTKQVSHFVQSISSGKFRQYDYNEHNQDYYNNSSPPDYLLERISAAFYLYHASEDFLTSEIDIRIMMERVQSVRSFKIVQNYHHSDFMYARNAKELVFKDILKFIQANSIQ